MVPGSFQQYQLHLETLVISAQKVYIDQGVCNNLFLKIIYRYKAYTKDGYMFKKPKRLRFYVCNNSVHVLEDTLYFMTHICSPEHFEFSFAYRFLSLLYGLGTLITYFLKCRL